MLYMMTFTINIPQMLAYIPYMDPMGNSICICTCTCLYSSLLPGESVHWLKKLVHG